jgi:predicted transcriptional regulator
MKFEVGLSARKKRGKWELIHDILKATHEGRFTKSRIMHKACLDWRNFRKYFDLLINEGLIARCDNSPDNYENTERGKKLLKQLGKIHETVADWSFSDGDI